MNEPIQSLNNLDLVDPAAVDGGALHSMISVKLNVVQAKISRQVGQAVQKLANLRLPEWRILSLLARRGPLSQAEIRVEIGMDKGQISRTVKSMTGNNLLAADSAPGQSRNVRLHLSDHGRAVHDRVHVMMEQHTEELMSSLNPQEQATFYWGLNQIEKAVDKLSNKNFDMPSQPPAQVSQPAESTEVEYSSTVA